MTFAPSRWVELAGAAFAVLTLGGCETYHPRPLPTAPDLAVSSDRLSIDPARLRVVPLKAITVDLRNGLTPLQVAVLTVLNSPALEAQRRAIGVSQAQVFAAGLLPDLAISAGYDAPTSGPDHDRAYNVGVDLDVAGLLANANARRAARASASQVDLDLLWSEWTTAQQARQLAETALAAERKATYLRRVTAIAVERDNRSSLALANHDVTLQTSSTDLALKLDAQSQLAAAEHDGRVARKELNGLLGLKADVNLPLREDPTEASYDQGTVRDSIASLAKRRPDILALQAGYEAQDANVRKAIIAQFPLTGLAANFAKDPSGTVTQGLSASLFLPVFNGGRGEARVQLATREQLRAEYQARLDAADVEARGAQADLQSARQVAIALRADAPRLESLLKPALSAYERRDIDSQTYLTLSQAALSHRADLDDKELAARLAEITLETALFLPPAAARAQP